MRRQSVIWTTLIVILLAGGQTYADTLLSFGNLFGPRRGSFGFSISIFEPSPVRYQPVYAAPAPPPSPWIVAPTYIAPPPVCPQPVVIERPVMVPTPVYIERPVFVQPPVYVTQPGGYPMYYQVPQQVRRGHPDRSGPMRSWDGAVRYQQVYVND
jgi:hypothetical protein